MCNDDTHFIIDHEFIGSFESFADDLHGITWWVYNAKFEQRWIDHYLPDETVTVRDVDFAKKVKMGGMPTSLAKMAKDVDIEMDKDEQSSDWSRPILTDNQLDYAAFDSHVTWLLKKKWWDEELNDEQRRAFHIFNDAVRGTVECEESGLHLNSALHQKTVALWERKQATFLNYVNKFTPPSVIKNIGSDKQLGDFLKKELHDDLIAEWPRTATGRIQVTNSLLKSMSRQLPYPMSRWMAAVAGWRYYKKYLSTYGDTLLTRQALEGKITSRFNIAQATTGRYSSSSSNLQNVPRKPIVRRAFDSPPAGDYIMPMGDYSGIEIRVLAELSGDRQLIHDAIYDDVHSQSAAQVFGYDAEEIKGVLEEKSGKHYSLFKDMRTKAKGFTFQLTYGAGPPALSDVLRCSVDEASEAIAKWAQRYPQAYGYRDKMFDLMMQDGFLPIVSGRTVYVRKDDRSMPVAANYPIQGAAADVMYRAITRVRNRFIEADLDAYLAATVHDELLTWAHREQADDAMAQLLKGMEEGWLDVFPGTSTDNLTDYAIGTSWADKP